MKHPFCSDIRGPMAPGADLVLGAAGRRLRSCPVPSGLCGAPLSSPFAGGCPCGSLPRPL